MPSLAEIDSYLEQLTPEQLRGLLAKFVPADSTHEQRVKAIADILNGPQGEMARAVLGKWIVKHIVPARRLVPSKHDRWVPVVKDAMLYVITHLSADRLAPKLLEQLELPPRTRAETRLLRLISMVPGLQKLGQVLARNRHLGAPLRHALMNLENGIRDIDTRTVHAQIRQQLGSRLNQFAVQLRPSILSEASVSAIVRFTWLNPQSGERERGVFKVMKPYIPVFFAEDMKLLQGLAEYFSGKLHAYGLRGDVLSDTFTKVRRLLEHEVNFEGEQKTLRDALQLYRSISGIRVPKLIEELSTPLMTAMSEEHAVKITTSARGLSGWQRQRLAERLVEALVMVPLFAAEEFPYFHADPHAGNLLHDRKSGSIVILDWALTERLSRDHRRHLALLFGYVALRDRVAVAREIEALRQNHATPKHHATRRVNEFVSEYLDSLPVATVPSPVDAMRLLEKLAINGVRFPASLIMLSKVLLTLDGILYDLGASSNCMTRSLIYHVVTRSLSFRNVITSPLRMKDWMSLQCSGLTYLVRLLVGGEEFLLEHLLPSPPQASVTAG